MKRTLPRFTIGRLMAAVALVGLALVQAWVSTLLVVLITAVVAVRSLRAQPRGSRSRHWAVAYFVTLACLYLPFGWLLGDFPWDSYRQTWIQLWPVLPGLAAGALVHPNDAAMTFVAGLVTLLLLALFTKLGSHSRAAMIVANGLVLCGTILESWIAYQLFIF